jgi:plastocyanin
MGTPRLLTALAVAVPLVLAPAASARDWSVEAVDWQFLPQETTVEVGDSITWRFTAAGHTSTSVAGQAESWNSAPTGSNPAGSAYTYVFTKPGRYEYICIPHQDFMRGVVEVRGGSGGAGGPLLASLATRRSGRAVRISFRLGADASVIYRLRGPSRRTVRRADLGPGDHRLRIRRLRRGVYHGTLTATDASGQKVRRANSFRIR